MPTPAKPSRRDALHRIAGGVRRRARYQWRTWRGQHHPPRFESAWRWLVAEIDREVAAPTPRAARLAGAVRLFIGSGDDLRASRLAEVLASAEPPQRLLDAAAVVRGLTEIAPVATAHLGDVHRRACVLAEHFDDGGAFDPRGDVDARWYADSVAVIVLSAIADVARRTNDVAMRDMVRLAWRQVQRRLDVERWDVPLDLYVARAAAVATFTGRDEARSVGELPRAEAMLRHGVVPAVAGGDWESIAGSAALATRCFECGDRAAGDAIMRRLERLPRLFGGFPRIVRRSRRFGRGRTAGAEPPSRRATIAWLFAMQAQVASRFVAGASVEEEPLDPHDGRLACVRRMLKSLAAGAVVADVGSGNGRYLRVLKAEFPRLRFVAIDASTAALAGVAEGIESRCGEMLRLPAENGEFDAAFAVEALEHALLPGAAVREMSRVVRPGGTVLVVDKLECRRALSECEPWERWFEAEEMCEYLAAAECDGVTVEELAHFDGGWREGLFCGWSGRRRVKVAKLAA